MNFLQLLILGVFGALPLGLVAQPVWGLNRPLMGLEIGWQNTLTMGVSGTVPIQGFEVARTPMAVRLRAELPVSTFGAFSGLRLQGGLEGWIAEWDRWAAGGSFCFEYTHHTDVMARMHGIGLYTEGAFAYRGEKGFIGPRVGYRQSLTTHIRFKDAHTETFQGRYNTTQGADSATNLDATGWYRFTMREFYLGAIGGVLAGKHLVLATGADWVLWPQQLGVRNNPQMGMFPFRATLLVGYRLGAE